MHLHLPLSILILIALPNSLHYSAMKDNKEECSEGSPPGKPIVKRQKYRGQFFLKSSRLKAPSISPFFPPLLSHFPASLKTSSSSSPPVSSLQGSSAINFAIIILIIARVGFWSSSFGSLFLGLFLNHLGSLLGLLGLSLSLLHHFEFQPLPPQFCVPPTVVLLLFFIIIMCIIPYLFVIMILIFCPNLLI